jgi:dihydrofolate synthase/folylpolyglutamate synthase
VTYAEAEQYLFLLPRFAVSGSEAYKPGLHRIKSLLSAMGQPQKSFDTILVAGTNGKGSTASMIAAIASHSGYNTGLHTSPHLQFFGERMRMNGIPADREWIQGAVTRYKGAIKESNASFFEASVALSLLFFAERNAELAVVEVGLGGRLDATNILEPDLSIITNIALDHTDILGSTLTAIAAEKGGIMRPEKPTLVGTTNPAVNMVLGDMADRIGSEFHMLSAEVEIGKTAEGELIIETMRERYGPIYVPIEGAHHIDHASLAIRTAELVSKKYPLMRSNAVDGIHQMSELSGLRGRMEQISSHPTIWLDVAHNPQSIEAAILTRTQPSGSPESRSMTYPLTDIMIGLQKDKDAESIANILSQTGIRITVLGMGHSRALSTDRLTDILNSAGAEVKAVFASTSEALASYISEQAHEDQPGPESTVLILGSHMIVAEALDWWASFKGHSENPS